VSPIDACCTRTRQGRTIWQSRFLRADHLNLQIELAFAGLAAKIVVTARTTEGSPVYNALSCSGSIGAQEWRRTKIAPRSSPYFRNGIFGQKSIPKLLLSRNDTPDAAPWVWHISLTTRHQMDVSVVNRLASRVSAVHTNVETPHGCILLNYLVSQSDQ
jgi:hypothetical protein